MQNKGVIIVIISAAFLFTFSQFLLITAYPTIMKEFNVNTTQVQWLTTASLLTTIIFIPLTGYLADKFSSRSLVIFSLGCLVLGTLIGCLSVAFSQLIFSRVVQSIGGGMMLPLVQIILLTVFPYERRGFAMGLLGAVVNVAPASAPALSGIIIDLLDWRALYWVLLPLACAVLLLAFIVMKDVLGKKDTKLDLFSIMLSALGFSFFVFGLSNISVVGFINVMVIIPLLIGIFTLFLFVRRQLLLRTPVLNLRLISNSTFRLTTFLIFINMMLLLSMETLLPMFSQEVLGTSAFLSGLLLVPGTIILSVVTFISGNLYDQYGGKKIALMGFSLTFTSLILMITIGMESSPYWIMIFFCVFMMGFGFTLMPLVTVSMNALENTDISHGSAIINTVRQFGLIFGIIVFSSIVSMTTSVMGTPYEVGAYWGTTYAFILMAIFALIGLILACFLKEENKAANHAT